MSIFTKDFRHQDVLPTAVFRMNNQVRFELPDLSQSDRAVDEALHLYREAREDLRGVSSTDEATRIKQQFEDTKAALNAECVRIDTSIRDLESHSGEINKLEAEMLEVKQNAAILGLNQNAGRCKNGHPMELRKRKDGTGFFVGCSGHFTNGCVEARALREDEKSRLES